MKICFLADSGSIHIVKWCAAFVNMGHEVSLISFNPNCEIPNIDFYPVNSGRIKTEGGNWRVLLKFKEIKKILKMINPEILHAHYATSYGVVGALTGFHPYAITAHGSDVLISPNNSKLYKALLRYAFKRSDWINLVSEHMREAVNRISFFSQKIDVIPFGIDTAIFKPMNVRLDSDTFVITSTRSFEPVYNLQHLIKAVGALKKEIPKIRLNLIGDGSEKTELKQLVSDLNLAEVTRFYGKVDQEKIVEVLNESQVYCSVSLSDGNSISLVEALACGCIPVVTDIVANHQWVKNDETGFLVGIDDVDHLTHTLRKVYDNYDDLVIKMGPINKKSIAEKADLKKNLLKIEEKYKQLIQSSR